MTTVQAGASPNTAAAKEASEIAATMKLCRVPLWRALLDMLTLRGLKW